jgi:hypothetical protein
MSGGLRESRIADRDAGNGNPSGALGTETPVGIAADRSSENPDTCGTAIIGTCRQARLPTMAALLWRRVTPHLTP